MPSLSDLIGNAIKQNLASQKSQLSNGAAGSVLGLKQNAVSTIVAPVNTAVNAVKGGINSAIGDAVSGNFSNIGNDLGGILKAFSNLSGPTAPSKLTVPQSNNTGGGNVLAGALSRPDALLSFNWFCDLPAISRSGPVYQLPWYYVEDVQAVFRRIETYSIFRQGRQKHYAKSFSVDSLNLTIYADNKGIAKSYLGLWSDLVFVPTTQRTWASSGGGLGAAAKYKQDIRVYVVDTKKNIAYILVYKECFPTSVQPFAFDSGTSTRLMFHVEFSVGDVFVETEATQNQTPTNAAQAAGSGYNAAKDSAAYDATGTGYATSDAEAQLPDEASTNEGDPTAQLPD